MRLRTILKVAGWIVTAIIALVLLLLVVGTGPLDRTPVQEKPAYATMMKRLDSLSGKPIPPVHGFSVGFAKENMTPDHPVALAGYGNRKGKPYTAVHDSIYVRAFVIDNGSARIAIVSADLLIIPPTVTALLEKQLPSIGFRLENTYLGATHTHNSIGNWGEGATGIIYGAYEDTVVHFIANKITRCIQQAAANLLPASLKTGQIPVGNAVRNRLFKEGRVDSLLRVLEVHRSDSSKLLLMSYTAHATCLYSRDLQLSRDYPGKLVDDMEASGYTFAMYLAGAVGSHGCNPPKYGEPCVEWMAEQVEEKFNANNDALSPVGDSVVYMERVKLELPPSDAKVAENWRLRPWIFRAAFGEYPVHLTALRLGDLLLLGTPCDFSGELTHSLDSLAALKNNRVMVTSFNGGYIGYITADQYYDRDHYETRLMNWYGPGNGAYVTECLARLMETLD